MKKTAVFILSAMFLLPCFAGCASKYDAAECKTPLNRSCDADNYYYRPDDRVLNFNHIIEGGGLKFYYEDGLSGKKSITASMLSSAFKNFATCRRRFIF